SGLPTGLSINSSTGAITGSISYNAAQTPNGSYSVTVNVTDDADVPATAHATFTWTVTDNNRTPEIASPGNKSNAEGASINLSVSASDADEDDTLSYSASGLPAGLSINSATGGISGAIGYNAAETSSGSYSVTVTAADSHSHSASGTFTWTVTDNNRAPQIASPGNRTSQENDSISLQVLAS